MLTFLAVLGLRPKLQNAAAPQIARVRERLRDFEWEKFGCRTKPPSYWRASSFSWGAEVFPRAIAPGLWMNGDNQRELSPMQFAFCPPGSKTPNDPKRPLNNARIESCSKWPWATAFKKIVASFRFQRSESHATGGKTLEQKSIFQSSME